MWSRTLALIAALLMSAALAAGLSPAARAETTFLPPDVQTSSFSLAQQRSAEARIRNLESRLLELSRLYDISEKTLRGVAIGLELRAPGLDDRKILAAVEQQVATIEALKSQLQVLGGGDTPEIARLRRQADHALDRGQISRAGSLLARVTDLRRESTQRRLASQAAANERTQVEQALDLIAQARIATMEWRFMAAISLLERAEAEGPPPRPTATAFLTGMKLSIYQAQGEIFSDRLALEKAIDLYPQILKASASDTDTEFQWRLRQRYAEANLDLGRLTGEADRFKVASDEYRKLADQGPEPRAVWRDHLARALMNYGRATSNADVLQEALKLAQDQADALPDDKDPADRARRLATLARIYSVLAEGRANPVFFDQAVATYKQALALTEGRDEASFVDISMTLGLALREQGRDQDAIDVLSQALDRTLKGRSARQYAVIGELQNNLGTAYVGLSAATGRDADAQTAVAAFEAALKARTKSGSPAEWAGTQNNLGLAWKQSFKITGDPIAYDNSMKAFEQALTVRTCTNNALEWSDIMTNKAWLEYYRAEKSKFEMDYDLAARDFHRVLQVIDMHSQPRRWARAAWGYGRTVVLSSRDSETDSVNLAREALGGVQTLYTAAGNWGEAGKAATDRARILALSGDRAEAPEQKLGWYRLALEAVSQGQDLMLKGLNGDTAIRRGAEPAALEIAKHFQAQLEQALAAPIWTDVTPAVIPPVRTSLRADGCPNDAI